MNVIGLFQFLTNLILPSLQAVPCATGANRTLPQLQIPNSPSPLHTSSPLLEQGVPPSRRAGLVPVGAAILAVPAVAGMKRLLNDGTPDTEADANADSDTEAEADPDAEGTAETDAEAETIGNDEDGLICRRTTSRFLISSAGAGAA